MFFLVIDASQLTIPSYPPLSFLNFIICQPIIIGSEVVRYLIIWMMKMRFYELFKGRRWAWFGCLERATFVLADDCNIDEIWVGLRIFAFRITFRHKNFYIFWIILVKLNFSINHSAVVLEVSKFHFSENPWYMPHIQIANCTMSNK